MIQIQIGQPCIYLSEEEIRFLTTTITCPYIA